MERRCSWYIEIMIAFQTWDAKTYEIVSVGDNGGSPRQDAYLGLVIDLHLRGSEELGVSPLPHPRVNLLPRRPDRRATENRTTQITYHQYASRKNRIRSMTYMMASANGIWLLHRAERKHLRSTCRCSSRSSSAP